MQAESSYANLLYKIDTWESARKMVEVSQKIDRDSLEQINISLSALSNSLFENEEALPYHDSQLEGKLFRFLMANSSLIKLLEKSNLKLHDKSYEVLDLYTINTLSRMQIETFLMIYYLSFSAGTDEEKDMRYDLYRLHGLKKQAGFSVKSKYGETKKREVTEEYENVLSQLKSRQVFKDLELSIQLKLLNLLHAKIIKSEVLFQESGLKDFGTNELWSLYSNHTHSEYISDRQLRSNYKNPNSIHSSANSNIQFQIILTAKLCRFLIEKFESPKKVIDQLTETARILIYTWGYQVNKKT
jgi:hypothetical protein